MRQKHGFPIHELMIVTALIASCAFAGVTQLVKTRAGPEQNFVLLTTVLILAVLAQIPTLSWFLPNDGGKRSLTELFITGFLALPFVIGALSLSLATWLGRAGAAIAALMVLGHLIMIIRSQSNSEDEARDQ